MVFSLRPIQEIGIDGYQSISDGRRHVIDYVQVYKHPDPGLKPEEKNYQILSWWGTKASLQDAYVSYLRLVAAIRKIAPQYVWGGQTTFTCYFNSVWGKNTSGTMLMLKFDGGSTKAARELWVQLRRRERNWANARFLSTNGVELMLRSPELEPKLIEFSFRMNPLPVIERLPLKELADFIESTKPQAKIYTKPRRGVKPKRRERFVSSPLSREQLATALKEIEEKWL
jgi:hypothetical protein